MTDVNAVTRPDVNSVVEAKYRDLTTPGFVAEFSPEEAELAGAFEDDALSMRDAYDSAFDAE
ncbi:TPA: conjugal transfer protein TraD [Escherichia coli]|uniref:conjugal transfer protein TraD n=1 Tax=Enterobacteriaceae TaxID=543 RepID=UPI0012857431|nr:conjugal transfer protein TraD [Cronobacter muytjensii]EAM5005955.1 conjugal transfer protein TraD [Salmonella enterica]EES5376833.1 conjugal transfer protein TraD [Escherichia coli]EAT8674960.1 conjugal transfer protein TraD [Salmonella enterica]EEC2753766.1 conjugal transfer protein TraD [Salmonella enterica]EES5680329.1 conjugal transfer protein TraD [Escherichia coli]